jgi:UPF0271 protein
MVKEKTVTSIDGVEVALNAETICLHGDTPGAVAIARTIREALTAAGVKLQAFGHSV